MDYSTLTLVRSSFESLYNRIYNTKGRSSSYKPSLLDAVSSLPVNEVIRELREYPQDIAFLRLLRAVCQERLLRHAVISSNLLVLPKERSTDGNMRWSRALIRLLEEWLLKEPSDSTEQAEIMQKMLKEARKRAGKTKSQHSLSLAQLLVNAETNMNAMKSLLQQIDEATSLLGNSYSVDVGDGMQEVVEALWAQIRAKYPQLAAAKSSKAKEPAAKSLLSQLEILLDSLSKKHVSLAALGFHLPKADVECGQGRDDDSDEDIWEEAVIINEPEGDESEDEDRIVQKATQPQECNIEKMLADGMARGSSKKFAKPAPVEDWAGIVKEGKGRDLNESILDRLEGKSDSRPGMTGGSRRGGRGRGGDWRGRRRKSPKLMSARDRIRKKLGIKKPKRSKSLLDD